MDLNDVTEEDTLERPRGIFTASVVAFHLEIPLKFQFTALKGSFQVNAPREAVKTPHVLFKGSFPVTSLMVRRVCLVIE